MSDINKYSILDIDGVADVANNLLDKLGTDEVFQSIWGKILAEECNDNNSIPKKLLYILAQMDREDAETFTTLCSLAVKVDDEYEPVIWCHRLDEYKKWGITFDKIISLIALGLIEANLGPIAPGYDSEYEMEKETKTVRVGNVLFTKSGQALHRAISVEKKEGFFEEYCLSMWRKEM